MATTASSVHLFGVRHHGPGSARRVLEALEALRPAAVLVEGPADATPLIPMLAAPEMTPPVTLMAYAADDPALAVFWPFAVFSPEYQALRWALANDAAAAFIDVPASWRLAERKALAAAEPELDPSPVEAPTEGDGRDLGDDAAAEDAPLAPGGADDDAEQPSAAARIRWDPIGALATAAGYDDGESWWRDVFEENPAPGEVFGAVAEAMAALREATRDAPERPDLGVCETDAVREAHMRLEIARALKETGGPVAVVCGAWHAPALGDRAAAKNDRAAAKDDRALLKGRDKVKIVATWAPWTAPRLASGAGYGAGVPAPGWCAHLWAHPTEAGGVVWLARVAGALREQGQIVSTASIIEAERLSKTLAAIRGRPAAGLEELRDASIACLCFGEALQWRQIEAALLIGAEVGSVPDGAPLAPLLEDLKRQQKAVRLKPEALERELALDLRSDSGLARSVLLHRLNALEVDWGRLADAGRSRGTFRERWTLCWKPEFAVKLVEHLVYGSTIEQAASGRAIARLAETKDLGALAHLALQAMTAKLDAAAAEAVRALDRRAAETSDCEQLLAALTPLADIIRYGEARERDTAQLGALALRIMTQAALALPYAARNLDAAAGCALGEKVAAADRAVELLSLSAEEARLWRRALRDVLDDPGATRLVAGLCARLLYEAEQLTAEEVASVLARRLSPGEPVAEAAGFFEGFFEAASRRLIFDEALRDAVDAWIGSLDAEAFTECLPLFRRVLSTLDAAERRQLLDRLFAARAAAPAGLRATPTSLAAWETHFQAVAALLTGEAGDGGR